MPNPRMTRAIFLVFLLLSACGRPLTEAEKSFASSLYGPDLDPARIRLVDGHFASNYTFRYPARPRVTCSERIFPPPPSDTITTSPGAITLFHKVFVREDLYVADFTSQNNLYDLMLFAHEMAHIWQWQNRKRTHYHPLKAASEHQTTTDPYLFDLTTSTNFLDYTYEQQAAIIEEFTCCRALAPKASRTARLHKMLSKALPVVRLQSKIDAHAKVPWRGAKLAGICD
ncbi:hypothetical protein [Thalassovita taeanensis]|nr:hypothetical protein [Thalassovita taeanensis]